MSRPFSLPPDAATKLGDPSGDPSGGRSAGAGDGGDGASGTGSGGERPQTGAEMTPDESRAFFETADRFLAVANAEAGRLGPGRVSAAMMFATARFNAFTAQTQGMKGGTVDDDAVRYFRDEYEKMLRENMGQTLIARD
ncbi:MAG: DUF3144 domain-containing protein [Pseudomonadota bacterium]